MVDGLNHVCITYQEVFAIARDDSEKQINQLILLQADGLMNRSAASIPSRKEPLERYCRSHRQHAHTSADAKHAPDLHDRQIDKVSER
jgi:hypothetical protein